MLLWSRDAGSGAFNVVFNVVFNAVGVVFTSVVGAHVLLPPLQQTVHIALVYVIGSVSTLKKDKKN